MTNINELNTRQSTLDLKSFSAAIVIGVGGIGSWVALNLALSGKIGTLFLIDSDTVEVSNLNRTPFRFQDIGNLKIDAMKNLILERRGMNVITIAMKTTDPEFRNEFEAHFASDGHPIIDCRDNMYEDMHNYSDIIYKVGYDGFNISIDGNPKETVLLNESTTDGYRVTPSFICPSQLAANLVVADLLQSVDHYSDKQYKTDRNGALNQLINLNSNDILNDIMKGRNN